MPKKQATPKHDPKTGKFIGKDTKDSAVSKKSKSKNLNSSKDKIGTSGTGAKNRRDKK